MIRISDFEQKWEQLHENHVFVACSGGVDSMVLLHLLHQIEVKITALHFNYQLRGKASDEDEELVRQTCKKLNVPFLARKADTARILSTQGGNLQDVARKLRYAWFREILVQDPSHLVALGHHLDDQVETFFQHIARKSGIAGMAGMLENHNGIIRPLLPYDKETIYAFAQENNIAWREDQSNESNLYTRNKLRNVVLPSIEKAVPDLKESVQILVKAFQQTRKTMEQTISAQVEQLHKTGNWYLEDFDTSTQEEKAEIIGSLGISKSFIREIEKIRFSQKGKKLYIGDFEITREANAIHFQQKEAPPVFILNTKLVESLPATFEKSVLYLDAARISGNLQLRTWQKGDRMQPLGMQGSKLVSDILNHAKIPSHQKKHIQVLTDDQRILWIAGIKIAAGITADEATQQILCVTISRQE